MASYSLNSYSIPDLRKLLTVARGESVRLEVGYQPSVTVKGQEVAVEGPVLIEEVAEELLRAVATNRELRAFRQCGTIDVILDARFLVRAVRAFDVFRLELHALKA